MPCKWYRKKVSGREARPARHRRRSPLSSLADPRRRNGRAAWAGLRSRGIPSQEAGRSTGWRSTVAWNRSLELIGISSVSFVVFLIVSLVTVYWTGSSKTQVFRYWRGASRGCKCICSGSGHNCRVPRRATGCHCRRYWSDRSRSVRRRCKVDPHR